MENVTSSICYVFFILSVFVKRCQAFGLMQSPIFLSTAIQRDVALSEKSVSFISTEKSCCLTENQLILLSSLNCDVYGAAFIEKLHDLQIYKNEHGNTLVPKRYPQNPSLGNWVNKCRQMYRKFQNGEPSSMNKDRIQILNEMGFQWDGRSFYNGDRNDDKHESCHTSPFESKLNACNSQTEGAFVSFEERIWIKSFKALKSIQQNNDDSPSLSSQSSLGLWASRQRREYRAYLRDEKSSMNENRIKLLDSINFDWNPSDTNWNVRVKELIEYKKKHGNCLVPANYKDNPSLGRWVSTQRKYYKLWRQKKPSRISSERVNQLTSIGFVWDRWEYNWNDRWKS